MDKGKEIGSQEITGEFIRYAAYYYSTLLQSTPNAKGILYKTTNQEDRYSVRFFDSERGYLVLNCDRLDIDKCINKHIELNSHAKLVDKKIGEHGTDFVENKKTAVLVFNLPIVPSEN